MLHIQILIRIVVNFYYCKRDLSTIIRIIHVLPTVLAYCYIFSPYDNCSIETFMAFL